MRSSRGAWVPWLATLVVLIALVLPVLDPVGAGTARGQVVSGATLSILSRLVQVAAAGTSFAPGSEGQSLSVGDRVQTGPQGGALLTYFDGSESWVAADTSTQVEALPTSSSGVQVFQAAGTVINRVQKSGTGTFQTDTPAAVALVRGTLYVVDVRPITAQSGATLAALLHGRLNASTLAEWAQAVGTRQLPDTRQLAGTLAEEAAPLVAPGATGGPPASGSQLSVLEIRYGAGSTTLPGVSFPRRVPESQYPLLRQSVYEDDRALWRVRTWEDPDTTATWDTFDGLGTAYPLVGESLYEDGSQDLWVVRTWRDPSSGATWDTFENLGRHEAVAETDGQQAASLAASQPTGPLSLTTIVVLEGVVECTGRQGTGSFTLASPGDVCIAVGPSVPPPPPPTPTPTATPLGNPVPTVTSTPRPARPTAAPTATPEPERESSPSDEPRPAPPPTAAATSTPAPDTTAPTITSVSDAPDPFSPNGDGVNDSTTISYTLSELANVTIKIYQDFGEGTVLVRTLLNGAPRSPGPHNEAWDGRNSEGGVVQSGYSYIYTIDAVDPAGNQAQQQQGTVRVDTVAPAAPTVSSPPPSATPVVVDQPSYSIEGSAEAGSLVRVWRDATNNGVKDPGDSLAGSQQLGPGSTAYAISVTLVQDANNDFIVTATDAAGNESAAADVTRIVEDSTAPAPPTGLTAQSVTGPSGTQDAQLSWTRSTSPDVQSQRVYRRSGTPTGPEQLLATLPPGASTYTDSDLGTCWTYYYQVAAVDAAGHESRSNQAGASEAGCG